MVVEGVGKHPPMLTMISPSYNATQALGGTLKTARRQKVVSYEAEVLFQGTHNHVVIELLKDEISDSSIDTYTFRQVGTGHYHTHTVNTAPPPSLQSLMCRWFARGHPPGQTVLDEPEEGQGLFVQ